MSSRDDLIADAILQLEERAQRAESQLDVEVRANSLMAAQFRTMQAEKEHGWREAERWEARAERAEAKVAAVAKLVDEMDHWCSSHGVATHYADSIRRALENS
jgi:hypothetical protein